MGLEVGGTKIVAKALDGQRYPLPPCECMWMCEGERGSGPEGADDLCLVCFRNFGLKAVIWTSKLVFGPQDLDLSLKAGILSQGWNFGLKARFWASRLGFGPQCWYLSLKVDIWVSWLGFGHLGWVLDLMAGVWPQGVDLGLGARI